MSDRKSRIVGFGRPDRVTHDLRTGVALVCALAGAALTACGDATAPFVADDEVVTIVVDFSTRPERWPLDGYQIVAADLRADTLTLRVDYGGGCADHTFALVAWNGWLETFPVRVGVLLSHDDRDDPCDSVVRSDLRFDLSPLRTAYTVAYGAGPASIILAMTDPAEPGGASLRFVSYAF